ncbi:MAG: chromate efflux transporter [Pseudomonadota bacterium]
MSGTTEGAGVASPPNPSSRPNAAVDDPGAEAGPQSPIPFSEALAVHARIGLLSFGGPAGQIALMQSEIVDRRGWVAPQAFDRGLSFAMMLPGPEAQQLATWLGWRMHGLAGGIAAGLSFILPGMVLMLALARIAAARGEAPFVAAIFAGVQPVVIAVVLQAMMKLGKRALGRTEAYALAAAAFAGIAILGLPFPLIVALAAVAGYVLLGDKDAQSAPQPADLPPFRDGALRIVAACVGIGLAVFALISLVLGSVPYTGVAELFTSAAFVSFGGAYALLPYVADRAVEHYGWLGPADMLNGLAIAEATPGPLILVNTYAGFFAGWSAEGGGAAMALTTGVLATFYTFLPSFMLILAFAPAVERIGTVPWARRALAGVSAAVVGVIANLALYLAEASFLPEGLTGTPAWAKIALFGVALYLVFARGMGVLLLVGLGAGAGLVLHFIGLL